MRKRGTKVILGGVLLILVSVLFGVTACGTKTEIAPMFTSTPTVSVISTATVLQGIDLPFEMIEQDDGDGYRGDGEYPPFFSEPRLILITAQDEVALLGDLKGFISEDALERLSSLDYDKYFVVALFRGTEPYSGYDTFIERIVQQEDQIVVYAQFWELSPYYGVTDSVTFPYHIVQVMRDNSVDQEMKLVLQSQSVTPTPPSP